MLGILYHVFPRYFSLVFLWASIPTVFFEGEHLFAGNKKMVEDFDVQR
jgi:hypothetical protein